LCQQVILLLCVLLLILHQLQLLGHAGCGAGSSCCFWGATAGARLLTVLLLLLLVLCMLLCHHSLPDAAPVGVPSLPKSVISLMAATNNAASTA
jgi:hypothetical protein